MLGAAFFFSVMNLGVRLLRGSIPPDVLVFYRSLFQVLVLAAFWREIRPKDGKYLERFKLHVPRGVFGVVSMVFLYIAMQQLPAALASLLTMTSVLWAILFGRIFLKETVTRRQVTFGSVALLGVFLSLYPGEGGGWHLNVLGTIGALMSGLCAGSAYTLLRKMRRSLETKEIVFFFGCTGVLLTAPSALLHFQLPGNLREGMLVLLVAACASSAQLLMTAGFKHTTAAIASVVNLQQVAFTVILGLLFLDESPPPHFYLGAAFVFLGLTGLLMRVKTATYKTQSKKDSELQ